MNTLNSTQPVNEINSPQTVNTQILALHEVVEQAFTNALANPSIQRWTSCAIVAGCAAVRLASDGKLFLASSMEGVAEEANRQALAMTPRGAA